jgi:hypothetical protein
MNIDEVETKFRTAFDGTRIVRYNQVAENPYTVGNGLCTGLCLNWARQTVVTERSRWWMLLDTGDAVRANAEFHQDKILQSAQAMANTKLGLIDKKRAEAKDTYFDKKNQLNKAMRGENGEGDNPWDDSTDQRVRAFVKKQDERRAQVDSECDRMAARVHDRALHVQWHWQPFCKSMQDEMKRKGTEYSDMVLEHVAPQAEYDGNQKQDGLKSVFSSLVSEKSFTTGRVACVGLWEMSGAKKQGHMIGIFHPAPKVYHVFDPNIGVWVFKNEQMEEAVSWLFFEAYPNLVDCSDKGRYEQDNTAKAEYLIFSRKSGAAIQAIDL